MGMQPSKDGMVEIRQAFWPPGKYCTKGCVHPLLVYADLLSIDDDRCYETAKMIYKKYLSYEIEGI